jgi:hypothetical protein
MNNARMNRILGAYKEHFVRSTFRPIRRVEPSWITTWETLDDTALGKHLNEEEIYGGRFRDWMDCLVLDFDNRTESADKNARAVINVFQAPMILNRSSGSGGIHMRIYLDKREESRRLKKLAAYHLMERGLNVNPGVIEIKGGNKDTLRLPLGKDSCLLDYDLKPLKRSKKEDLLWIAETPIERIPLEALFGGTLPKIPPDYFQKHRTSVIPLLSRKDILQDAKDLLIRGLTKPSTKHTAIYELAIYHIQMCGMDPQQANREICEWIDKHHNGLSKDYHADPEGVYKEIEAMVNWVSTRNGHPLLTPSETRTIVDDQRLNYRQKNMLAELVKLTKNRCEQGDHEAEAYISQKLFIKMAKDRNVYKECRDRLKDCGYLILLQHHSQAVRRAALYRVRFPFDHSEPGSFCSLEEGIRKVCTIEEILRI